ncbi:hypothetical protein MTO96_018725 [Rhipicephalus appendiculatus]
MERLPCLLLQAFLLLYTPDVLPDAAFLRSDSSCTAEMPVNSTLPPRVATHQFLRQQPWSSTAAIKAAIFVGGPTYKHFPGEACLGHDTGYRMERLPCLLLQAFLLFYTTDVLPDAAFLRGDSSCTAEMPVNSTLPPRVATHQFLRQQPWSSTAAIKAAIFVGGPTYKHFPGEACLGHDTGYRMERLPCLLLQAFLLFYTTDVLPDAAFLRSDSSCTAEMPVNSTLPQRVATHQFLRQQPWSSTAASKAAIFVGGPTYKHFPGEACLGHDTGYRMERLPCLLLQAFLLFYTTDVLPDTAFLRGDSSCTAEMPVNSTLPPRVATHQFLRQQPWSSTTTINAAIFMGGTAYKHFPGDACLGHDTGSIMERSPCLLLQAFLLLYTPDVLPDAAFLRGDSSCTAEMPVNSTLPPRVATHQFLRQQPWSSTTTIKATIFMGGTAYKHFPGDACLGHDTGSIMERLPCLLLQAFLLLYTPDVLPDAAFLRGDSSCTAEMPVNSDATAKSGYSSVPTPATMVIDCRKQGRYLCGRPHI